MRIRFVYCKEPKGLDQLALNSVSRIVPRTSTYTMAPSNSQWLSLGTIAATALLLAASGCNSGVSGKISNETTDLNPIIFTDIGDCYADVNYKSVEIQNDDSIHFVNSTSHRIRIYFLPIKYRGNSSEAEFDLQLNTGSTGSIRIIGIADTTYSYVGYLSGRNGCSQPSLTPGKGGSLIPLDPPKVIIRD